ncbi:unnamed protein product [Caenorhabditis brenneri]
MSALTDTTNTMPSGEILGADEPKKTTDVVEKTTETMDSGKIEEAPKLSESSEVSVEETKETLEEKNKRLDEQIIGGRRFMKLNEFAKAAELFSRAAELSTEIHGEDQFEITFLYGQALLQLAKIEDEVLNNALSDIPKDKDGDEEQKEGEDDGNVENPDNVPEEERAEIRQQVEEALGVADEKEDDVVVTPEAEVATEGVTEAMEQEKVVDQEEVAEGTTEEEEKVGGDGDAQEEVVATNGETEMETEAEDGEEVEEDEEEDEDPMKLAWEVLETARCICEKKITSIDAADTENLKTWKLNHAEVLCSLGEYGMIDQKYEQAQNDLLAAAEIQVSYLPPTSRLLANTQHLLGKVFILSCDCEKAVEHFSNAKNILIAKVEELKSVEGEEEQIKELEELIPDIDALVVDAANSKEQYDKMKETMAEEMKEVASVLSKFEGEAQDITGLVRRKRPAEEVKDDGAKEGEGKEEEGQESKKQKTEDEVVPEVVGETDIQE